MKRIIIAVAVLLFTSATFAQTNTPPPSGGAHKAVATPDERAKKETDRINTLTPLGDAYQKVLDANKDFEAKRASIRNGAKMNELTDDQKAKINALKEAHKANLKAAMGADLFAKYEAARKAQNEQNKGEGGGGHQRE